MSSTSARREALSATVGGLGTFGWLMTGAADILTGDAGDQYNACAGRKGVSPAPWVARVAFVPFALAVRPLAPPTLSGFGVFGREPSVSAKVESLPRAVHGVHVTECCGGVGAGHAGFLRRHEVQVGFF